MGLRITRLWQIGNYVRVAVRLHPAAGRVIAIAYARGRRHLSRRFALGTTSHSSVTLIGKLSAGRWTVAVSGKPARGYATPKQHRINVTVRTEVEATTLIIDANPLEIGLGDGAAPYVNQSCFWQLLPIRSPAATSCVR